MKRGQHVRIPWLHSVSVAELVIKLQFLYNSRQVPDSGLKILLKQIFNIQDHLFPFCVKYFYLLQVMSSIVFRRFVINKGIWKICRRGEPHSAPGSAQEPGHCFEGSIFCYIPKFRFRFLNKTGFIFSTKTTLHITLFRRGREEQFPHLSLRREYTASQAECN